MYIAHTDNRATCETSDINAEGRRLEWRISCYCCRCSWNPSFYARDFNAVYAFNDRGLSHLKEWRDQSSCLTTFIISANSVDISFRSTSLFLAVFVVSLEQQLMRAAVSLFKTSWFFFFVRCNAVSKCVHVDVYPNAGQCHASKYAIVTVHVLQQHSTDCLKSNKYVTC